MKKLSLILLPLIIFWGCSAHVAVPNVEPIADNQTAKEFKVKPYVSDLKYQDINNKNIKMPTIGEKNALGILITPELKIAYDNYFGGDGEMTLEALEKANKETTDVLTLWQISFLKTQTFIMLGRDADAQAEVLNCEKYENIFSKHNINSIALRGQIYLMEGEFDKARKDFQNVLSSIGNWELPTSYGLPPANISELVLITTAQLRSYTGMAASYVLQGNYSTALFWAKEAEARFNAVHYISNHGLYGMFMPSHLDSYYGRAVNMSMLASAILGSTKNYDEANKYYDEAINFFNKINYQKGEIITLALKAQTLSMIGKFNDANNVALEAIAIANKKEMYDFIWRIESLRGIILLKEDRVNDAQKAFRNASNVIDLVSGELQTDTAKRRFGVGKSDLVYNLINIDMKNKDYKQLFTDLEQGRARAFVDIMKDRAIAQDKSNAILQEIRKIDKQIKTLVIQNNSINLPNNIQEQQLLREKREKLIAKLIVTHPNSASIVASFSYTLDDIQKALGNNESIIYFLPVKADEKIKALLIDNFRTTLKTYEITPEKLSSLMNTYLTSIDADANSISQELRSFKKKKNDPSTEMIADKYSTLGDIHTGISLSDVKTKRLYIIGSGATTYIPWGTYDNNLEVSILPNASWILNKNKSNNYQNVVIVGNPDYGGELAQLSGTIEEAQVLSDMYNTKPLLYKNATLKNIKQGIGGGAKVLHLATHGVFYNDKPLESAIFLSKDSTLFTLSAKDIFESPISADLVVLSACETGMGKNIAGDDLLGLPRSFFLGGTKAILSSLWPIDDAGTKDFMIVFHKYAKDKKYVKGLLEAKKYLKSKGYPASVYGAFVLYGTSL